jgi:hypothetical protein
VAPQGAKYSHENVKKEKEISRVSFVSFSLFIVSKIWMPVKGSWIQLGSTGS